MSTKSTTDSSSASNLQYDPAARGLYGALTGGAGNVLQQYMNNPFGNALYQMGLGQGVKGAQQGGSNLMQSLMQNMKVSGLSGQSGQGFQQAQTGRIGRATQGAVGNANISNVMAALQRQMQATGMGMSFQPLLTGESGKSSTVQQQSGLGTWLPQLLGAGLGMATSGFGGGGMASAMRTGDTGSPQAPTGNSGIFGTVPGSFGPPSSGLPSPWLLGGV